MSTSVIDGNLRVQGTLSPSVISLPANSVNNASIVASAGVSASKVQQQRNIQYGQVIGSAAAAANIPVFRCNGVTGEIKSVKASLVTIPSGDKTVTVDVKKNGTTVLSSTIQLDSGNTTLVAEAGTLSVTSLAAGDILTVVVTTGGSTGTNPDGLLVNVVVEEDPA